MRLDIRGLSFSYDGQRQILDKLDLSFSCGDFVVVLGRNGAGKTTLFRNLLGLLRPQSGTVEVDGVDFLHLSAKERAKRIAYIPQESHPSFSYSVLTTVLMGTTSQISTLASPGQKETEAALAALRRFGIEDLASRRVDSLSGGERQLVMCARALAQKAPILLFDEPTSSLDWGNQIRTLENIRRLTKEGYLAIVSTHNLEQALNYASRIVMLCDGKLVADASPQELAMQGSLSSFYGLDVSVERIRGHYVCIPQTEDDDGLVD